MDKQVIIAINREFGSDGHIVARMIAEQLGMEIYDRALLDKLSENMNVDADYLEKYDEKPKGLFSKRVMGESSSFEENLALMQFDYLKQRAAEGESFVVVGRCAGSVLKDYPGLIRIFISADMKDKVARTMAKHNISEDRAILKINRHDAKRKSYHNTYSDYKWGDSRHYDICINNSKLGIEKTASILVEFIKGMIDNF